MDNRLIDDVPRDVTTHYVENLSNVDLARAMQASKYCYGIFNSPEAFETKILSEFPVPPEALADVVSAYKKYFDTTEFNYKFLYFQLRHLRKIEHKLPKPLRFYYADPEYAVQVLTCCMDDKDFAEKVIPATELFGWVELAMYAGFNDVATLVKNTSEDIDRQSQVLIGIIRSGNLELAQWHHNYLKNLIYNDPAFNDYLEINYSKQMVKAAILSFSFEMVEWVLTIAYKAHQKKCQNKFLPAYIGGEILALAYQSGDEKFIRSLEERLNCSIKVNFSHLAASGNLPFIKQTLQSFIKKSHGDQEIEVITDNQFFDFTLPMLEEAALNGHLEVVKYGIETTKLDFNIRVLFGAALSGNLGLFKYVLSCFGIEKIDKFCRYICLEKAALSGNAKLFNYCQQALQVAMDIVIFKSVIKSKNLFFIEQIRKEHRFDLSLPTKIISSRGTEIAPLLSQYEYRNTYNHGLDQWKTMYDFFTSHLSSHFQEVGIDKLINPFYICLLAEVLQYPAEYYVKDEDLPKLVALLERVIPFIGCGIDLGEYVVDKKYINNALKEASAALVVTHRELASRLDDLRETLHNREFKKDEPHPTTVTVDLRK